MKKKLTKNTLDELAKAMPIISEWEMRTMVAGSGVLGSAENPYTASDFEMILNAGAWTSGGFVEGMGYVGAETTKLVQCLRKVCLAPTTLEPQKILY